MAWKAIPVAFTYNNIVNHDDGSCGYKMQQGNTVGLLAKKMAGETGLPYDRVFADICRLNGFPAGDPNAAVFKKIAVGTEINLPSYTFLSKYAGKGFKPDAELSKMNGELTNPAGASTTRFAEDAAAAAESTRRGTPITFDLSSDHVHMHPDDVRRKSVPLSGKDSYRDWCAENRTDMFGEDYPGLVAEVIKLNDAAKVELAAIAEKHGVDPDYLATLPVEDLVLYTSAGDIPNLTRLAEVQKTFIETNLDPLNPADILAIAKGEQTFKEAVVEAWGEEEYYRITKRDYDRPTEVAMEIWAAGDATSSDTFITYANERAEEVRASVKAKASRLLPQARVEMARAKEAGSVSKVCEVFAKNTMALSTEEKMIVEGDMEGTQAYLAALKDGEAPDPLELAETFTQTNNHAYVAYLGKFANDNHAVYLASHKEEIAGRRERLTSVGLDPNDLQYMKLNSEQVAALVAARESFGEDRTAIAKAEES